MVGEVGGGGRLIWKMQGDVNMCKFVISMLRLPLPWQYSKQIAGRSGWVGWGGHLQAVAPLAAIDFLAFRVNAPLYLHLFSLPSFLHHGRI